MTLSSENSGRIRVCISSGIPAETPNRVLSHLMLKIHQKPGIRGKEEVNPYNGINCL